MLISFITITAVCALLVAGFAAARRYALQHREWKHDAIPGKVVPRARGVDVLRDVNFYGRTHREKHGPVYRVCAGSRPVLVLADVDVAREFYKEQRHHNRSRSFTVFGVVCDKLIGDAVGTKTGAEWTRHRAPFKTQFGRPTANSRRHLCVRHANALRDRMLAGTAFSMHDINLHRFTLDVLSDVVYGPELAGSRRQDIHDIAKLHDAIVQQMGSPATRLPGYRWLPTRLNADLLQFQTRWAQLNDDMWAAVPASDDTVLGHLKALESAARLSRAEVYANLDEILLLNIDVMESALASQFTLLAKYPVWQQRLREEIEQITSARAGAATAASSSPDNQLHNMTDLPVMSMFVQEAARTCPALALSFPEVTHRDRVLGGYRIPAGTVVVVDAFSINNDASNFPDPHVFDPLARFDRTSSPDGAPKRLRLFHRTGLGARKCMGANYADAVIAAVLQTVVPAMDLHIAVPAAAASMEPVSEPFGFQPPAGPKGSGLAFFTPFMDFPRLTAAPVQASRRPPRPIGAVAQAGGSHPQAQQAGGSSGSLSPTPAPTARVHDDTPSARGH